MHAPPSAGARRRPRLVPRLLLGLALVHGLPGCSPAPRPAAVDDAALAGWVDAFQQDAPAARQRLAAVGDAAERDLLILGLLSATPALARQLCGLATAPETAAHCDRLQKRPHLFGADAAGPPPPMAAGHHGPPPLAGLRSRWADQPADAGGCPAGPDQSRCLFAAAATAAAAGDTATAAGRCRAQTAPVSREDCFFRAAEAALQADQPLAVSVALCAGATQFQGECLSHLHAARADRLGALSPAAAVAATAAELAALERFWAETAPDAAPLATAQYLYSAAGQLIGETGIAPVVWAQAPAALAPHLRTHIGRRVATLDDPWSAARSLAAGQPVALPPADSAAFRFTVGVGADDRRPKLALGSGTRYRLADPEPARDLELAVAQALADLDRAEPRTAALDQATRLRPGERRWLHQLARRRH